MSESGSRLRGALGGLEAGVLGSLGMLATFFVGSWLTHRSFWLVPNLIATGFHGASVYNNAFTRSTMTGISFILLLYGSMGVLWGLFWGSRPVFRLWIGGAIAGYLIYMLFGAVLWKNFAPWVTVYAPEMQMRVAHVVWGILLGQSPRYAAVPRQTSAGTIAEETPPDPDTTPYNN